MTRDSESIPSQDPAELGVRWCLALLDGLITGGIHELVLSPGSRSTPVVLAAQRRPRLKLTPILDERSAAFYALGLARASGRPVGLLATSGSAPAHWYPAVIEASESGVPLILLSADRPPELRGWGANQTVEQTRLFGCHVRAFHDPGAPQDSPALIKALRALGIRAATVSRGPDPGPVHINLPLREPLVPRSAWALDVDFQDAVSPIEHPWEPKAPQIGSAPQPSQAFKDRLRGRGVIYCGPDTPRTGFPEALWRCAAALGAPVLADPLSEVRFGPGPEATGIRPADRSLQVHYPQPGGGAAPQSRTGCSDSVGPRSPRRCWSGWRGSLRSWWTRRGAGADPHHELAQPRSMHLATDPVALCEALAADPPSQAGDDWPGLWAQAERRVAELTETYLREAPWCEAQLIRDLLARPAPGGRTPLRQLTADPPIRDLVRHPGGPPAALRQSGGERHRRTALDPRRAQRHGRPHHGAARGPVLPA